MVQEVLYGDCSFWSLGFWQDGLGLLLKLAVQAALIISVQIITPHLQSALSHPLTHCCSC